MITIVSGMYVKTLRPTKSPLSGDAERETGVTGSSSLDPILGDQTAADRGEASSTGVADIASATWSFQASTTLTGNLSLQSASGRLQQRFKMDNNKIASKLSFTQVNRPVVTENFLQGSEQESQTENFLQNSNASGLLDVLLVIDDSGSMKEEQTKLANKLLPLLSYVKDSDWNIGVVTTDPKEGCLRGLIKKSDRNAEQLFSSAVNAGVQGSGNERGIYQAVAGLKGECNQTGTWLRSNSTVAVLIVSDEDNCSVDGKDCAGDAWAKSDYLVNYLKSIRRVGVNARTYGLIWHPSQTQSACNTAFHPASVYADAITKTGGTWGSICDADYSQTLQSISYDLSVILRTQFALQHEPLGATLKVYVNGQLKTAGYKLSGNVLEFSEAPAAGASIKIQYSFMYDPPKQEFVLANAADPSSLLVYLDGEASKAFTYDAATMSIRFSSAPMVNEIKTVYRKAEALNKDFQIGLEAQTSSIRASVNGQANTNFSYNVKTGLVHFNIAPADGSQIDLSFEQVLDARLRYPIYAAQDQRSQVKVYDALTMKLLPVEIDGDEILFAAAQFQALREILVVYPIPGKQGMLIDLGREVNNESLIVRGNKSGLCQVSLLSVTAGIVDLSRCSFAASEAISIEFQYPGETKTSFDLGLLDLDLSEYRWKILLNGVETLDYSLVQNTLSFPSLAYDSRVDVSLYKITH
ncbi:MAG: hypothetical protein NTX25_06150 [Proteobacteria bacterium]|nr:hypothetical protein [Pseudomonadota bacterium]